ncbi:MAG: SUMF1/EgtB/PvdO family nonheme iron enzyme [Planctomycetota bacterium]
MTDTANPEASIFICYRHSDCEAEAKRLRDEFRAASESFQAFVDSQDTDGGTEWPLHLRKALDSARVLVVLIGPHWLRTHDQYGRRRLDDPRDWVRSEIERGLQKRAEDRDFLMLPVLLPAPDPTDPTAPPASLPKLPPADALPPNIVGLCDLQAIVAEGNSFAKVIARIRRHLQGIPPEPKPRRESGTAAKGVELETYRRQVQRAHSELSLVGFPRTEQFQVPIRLEELYVPLDATADLRRERDQRFATSKDLDEGDLREGLVDLQLIDAFRRAQRHGKRRGVVILGDPGAGKTTHMRRLALGVVDPRLGPKALGMPDDVLPVFLPLRHLVAADLDTLGEDLLVRSCDKHLAPTAESAHHLLNDRGQLLYLFDGLDEVPADLRMATAHWIESLRKRDETSWFAITSRYAGYTEDVSLDAHFLEVHLRPLTNVQIDDFVHNWYRIVENTFDPDHAAVRAPTCARDLLERLRVKSLAATRVAEMSGNPLLLTIICLIHRSRGQALPDARLALYEDCLVCLLHLWREAKTLGNHLGHDDGERLLQPLALHYHQRGEARLPSDEIVPLLAEELRRRGLRVDPEQFLRAVRDESGLLTGWSNDSYGFLHLGFQEHLAAKELVSRSQDAALAGEKLESLDELAERFGESWWEEVTLLLLAQCSQTLFRRFFERVLHRSDIAAHESFLQQCLREAREKDSTPFESFLKRKRPKVSPEQRAVTERAIRQIEGRGARVEVVSSGSGESPVDPGGLIQRERFVHPECGVEMVRIPAGSFRMGGKRHGDEKPVHDVTFAQPFWMAATAVTNEQFRKFCELTGHTPPESFKNRQLNGSEQPVVEIRWRDAAAFCEWAGLILPTESMWEYACRAGTKTEYWSGDAEDALARVGWYRENSGGRLHAVAEKAANPFGLFDMHGNVWEWCEDTWHGSYRGAPDDGSAWVDKGSPYRVVRGGSFQDDAKGCRSSYRFWRHPSDRGGDQGFRPASSSLDPFTAS